MVFLKNYLILITHNGCSQDISGFCFYYGHASSDCIIMSSYWTTLEYDECNVIFHGVC